MAHTPTRPTAESESTSNVKSQSRFRTERKQLSVGDPVEFQTSAGPCTAFFRHGQRKTDDRFGFDLTCANPESPQ